MQLCISLLLVFGCFSPKLAEQGFCGAGDGDAAPQEATGCGCDKLKRAAATAAEPGEDVTADTADMYSRAANERQPGAAGDQRQVQSQVMSACARFTDLCTFHTRTKRGNCGTCGFHMPASV